MPLALLSGFFYLAQTGCCGLVEPLKFVLQFIELVIGQIFHLHQRRASRLNRSDQLIQFQLNDFRIAILRVLNQENDQKGAE